MIALIQRARSAQVRVENKIVGEIEHGILAFLGIEKEDTEAKAERLLQRVLGYRIFADDTGRMNRSLRDINGGLLVVSQFTLPADTRKGMRPSFSCAAPPALGEALYDYFLDNAKKRHDKVASGIFAADMQVSLVNDGPVTFWLTV